jgi:addiction module HigA family antidote
MISGASASHGLKSGLQTLRSWSTTEGINMARPGNRMRPVHPGEVLREDYLVPLGLSVDALSVALGVPATRIHEIVKERRAVTADTAARLARHFGGDAVSWLVMQANCDLKTLPTRQDIERKVAVREPLAAWHPGEASSLHRPDALRRFRHQHPMSGE